MVFSKSQQIGDYTVAFPIKEGAYAESYRVKDAGGKNYFLKLFNYSKLHRTQFDGDGNILEIEIAKKLNHPNLIAFKGSGEIINGGQKYAYVVTDFISGETVAERVSRDQGCTVRDAKLIVEGVLEGVKFLHNLPVPVIHNELTIQNVMLDLSAKRMKPIIIDFGYARYLNQGQYAFQKQGLNPFYVAPESFNGVFTAQSDLFSIGAMLYNLLYGLPPFFVDLSKYKSDSRPVEEIIAQERERPLKILAKEGPKTDAALINTIAKALAVDVDKRFHSAEEFLQALRGEISVSAPTPPEIWDIGETRKGTETKAQNDNPFEVRKSEGKGFAEVAGMEDLKEQLRSDVIQVVKEPERAKKFGLHIPNGLLFYGPPGCGKTYFAEKFAEEAGFNFIKAKCSDVASPYIHGGQEKIAALFDEARKNSPVIVLLDEIEVLLFDRKKQDNSSMSGEVNEFLVQLNNCGADGVMVIGATNEPQIIDKAALRSGRLEYHYFIPLPSQEVRKGIFEIHLSDKDKAQDVDLNKLAEMTEGFTSSDIKLIVEKAGRTAFQAHKDEITMDILEEVIKGSKSSVSPAERARYEEIKNSFEGNTTAPTRRKIGF